MATTEPEPREVIYLIVPARLKRLLDQARKENQRSMNGECIVRLQRSLRAESSQPGEWRQP